MKTLIIPCAGGEMIDGLPLILNRHPHDGKILAEKLLTGIFPETWSRIIFAVTAEMEQKFSVSAVIRRNIARAEAAVLPERTSGAAETVYRTIIQAGVSGEFAVKDSHNRITLDAPVEGNAIAGLDLMKGDYTVENLRRKSFLVLNEQDNLRDIAEKRLRSDVISAGLYSFRDAGEFVRAFLRLSAWDYGLTGLYVSHVISYMIGRSDFVFHCSRVKEFEDWSSPVSWQKLRRSSVHELGRKVRVIMVDLDGTLFDTADVNYSAYQEAVSPFGGKIDRDYFREFCNGRHYREFLPEIMPGITDEIMKQVHSAKKVLYKKYIHLARLNAGLLGVLDMCRSESRIALVTTASRENTHDLLSTFGLGNYFDLVLTHEDITHGKPDPEGYIKAMEFFGAEPEECIIFEDSPTGMEAAERSGVQYFAVNMKKGLDDVKHNVYNCTSHHITSHHITSHHITSHHIHNFI